MKNKRIPHNFIDLTNKNFGLLYVKKKSNKKLSKIKSNAFEYASC